MSEQNIHFVPKTVESHCSPEGVSRQTVIFHNGDSDHKKSGNVERFCFLGGRTEQINSAQQQRGIKSTRSKLKRLPVRNTERQTDRETRELPSEPRAADWNWLLHLLPFRGETESSPRGEDRADPIQQWTG